MNSATIYLFSGLPGSGKSTLASRLSKDFDCTYLRIDTKEQALRDLCNFDVQGEGYRLAYRIAAENVQLGHSVIADSYNHIEITRREWRRVAEDQNCRSIDIEVVCSDPTEHRMRVETRDSDIPNLVPPTWQQVTSREYETCTTKTICVDTAGRKPEESFQLLKNNLKEYGG